MSRGSILTQSVSLSLGWVSPARAADHMARTGYVICEAQYKMTMQDPPVQNY